MNQVCVCVCVCVCVRYNFLIIANASNILVCKFVCECVWVLRCMDFMQSANVSNLRVRVCLCICVRACVFRCMDFMRSANASTETPTPGSTAPKCLTTWMSPPSLTDVCFCVLFVICYIMYVLYITFGCSWQTHDIRSLVYVCRVCLSCMPAVYIDMYTYHIHSVWCTHRHMSCTYVSHVGFPCIDESKIFVLSRIIYIRSYVN